MPPDAPEALAAALDDILAQAQAEQRMPSVSAAVIHDGDVIWRRAIGLADVAREEVATLDHAYRVGSITKTFTAVAIMQLRDAGRLALDDPVRTLLPEFPHGPTIRQALTHLTGIQREPPGEIWETLRPPSREELVAGLEDAERVLAPGQAWHYSNLAFALLGEIVARTAGSYEGVVRERILDPLGLHRTRFRPDGPRATPYFVEPYSDTVRVEPDPDVAESTAAAGWLWSTPTELVRWADFLAVGRDDVLARGSLDEMARVHAMVDESWTVGWGLGLELFRRGERVLVGHTGAMPGFLAGVCIHRGERTGAAVSTNTSAGVRPDTLALALAEAALGALPRPPATWRPDDGPPSEVAPLLGRWWSEGEELVLSWKDGRLRLELLVGPPGANVSWLEPADAERWRVVEGRERGELLRIARDDEGAPTRLYLATYPLTRAPSTFGS